MTAPTPQIEFIHQLKITCLEDHKYLFSWIFLMSDKTFEANEQILDPQKAKAYLKKKGWPDYLPKEPGQTTPVVLRGSFVPNPNVLK